MITPTGPKQKTTPKSTPKKPKVRKKKTPNPSQPIGPVESDIDDDDPKNLEFEKHTPLVDQAIQKQNEDARARVDENLRGHGLIQELRQ